MVKPLLLFDSFVGVGSSYRLIGCVLPPQEASTLASSRRPSALADDITAQEAAQEAQRPVRSSTETWRPNQQRRSVQKQQLRARLLRFLARAQQDESDLVRPFLSLFHLFIYPLAHFPVFGHVVLIRRNTSKAARTTARS